MRLGLKYTTKILKLTLASILIFTTVVDIQGQMPEILSIPQEMHKLAFIQGSWENESIFLNAVGQERKRSRFHSEIYPVMDGRAYEMKSFNQGREVGKSLLFYHQATGKYVMVALDAWGNYDEFVGNFENEKLILTSKERVFKNGKSMMWRRTYSHFGDDRHKIVMHYSLDQGKSWILSNRQEEWRTGD